MKTAKTWLIKERVRWRQDMKDLHFIFEQQTILDKAAFLNFLYRAGLKGYSGIS